MSDFLILRGLKSVVHTVFAVADGQKTYWNNIYHKYVPYSSGQQVKRSIVTSALDFLQEEQAPMTFIYTKTKDALKQNQALATCDPQYTEEILRGWMRAEGDGKGELKSGNIPVKRRSPLSISAMTPLHPLLADLVKEDIITLDRSDRPDLHPAVVYNEKIKEGNELSDEEVSAFLAAINRALPRMNLFGNKPHTRVTGLFVYDIAIDKRRLFSISLNEQTPELRNGYADKLKDEGWTESENVFGKCLVCPKERQTQIIKGLAHGLTNWRITSNQARTYSPMQTLAIAISDDASKPPVAIRAKLTTNSENSGTQAIPVITKPKNTELFVSLNAEEHIPNIEGDEDAMINAQHKIIELLSN